MTTTILVLAANPRNTPPLRLDQEVREIDNGLQRAQRRDDFVLRQKFASRPVDVRRAMLDYEPNIVHFCGHGSGDEGIVFEDEQGQAKLISTEAISGFFQLFSDKVECVVLNACYSEVQAQAISEYIPFVIGMKKGIGDSAAIEFAVAFYDALGAGRPINFAYKLACNAIQWTGLPEHLTPVIHTRTLEKREASISLGTYSQEKKPPIHLKILITGGIEISHTLSELSYALGQHVITRGHSLLNNGSAGVDKLSAEGAFSACRANNVDPNSKIMVFRPRKSPEPHFSFGKLEIIGNNFDERRDYVIKSSDILILLGGSDGTKKVIQKAQTIGKPIIPIGVGTEYDAAVQLWHILINRPDLGLRKDDLQLISPEMKDLNQVALSAVLIAENLLKPKKEGH
jgi:predicted Rossmann-fold nucleotide-binding protein